MAVLRTISVGILLISVFGTSLTSLVQVRQSRRLPFPKRTTTTKKPSEHYTTTTAATTTTTTKTHGFLGDIELFDVSSSSSSESGSVEARDMKLVFKDTTDKAIEGTTTSPPYILISGFEKYASSSALTHFPPAKVFVIIQAITNISLSSCPKLDRKFFDSLNHFIAGTLAKSETNEAPLSAHGELIFKENYKRLKVCQHRISSEPLIHSQVLVSSWQDLSSEDAPSGAKSSSKTTSRKKRSSGIKISAVGPGHDSESQHSYMISLISSYLHQIISNMRVSCLHSARPTRSFLVNFINDVAIRMYKEADRKVIVTAIHKYLKKGTFYLGQLFECHSKIRDVHFWTIDHDDDGEDS